MAMGTMSPAASDLGLGAQLSDQVKSETEEERRKRLASMSGMSGRANLSPGAMSLLGGPGGSFSG